MSDSRVIILMGSASDAAHGGRITEWLDKFGILHETRIASAHKNPRVLLNILDELEKDESVAVYITVAGLSNALSGMVDCATVKPVLACPPSLSELGGADIFSSLRMPPGVACATVLDPRNAALFAAKVIALGDSEVRSRIRAFRESQRADLGAADAAARGRAASPGAL